MEVDVLIVGGGVAGLLLARAVGELGRRAIVVSDPARAPAARAAIGLLNPVSGPRCTLAWQAASAIPAARETYAAIARRTRAPNLFRDLPILRVLRDPGTAAAWDQRQAGIVAAGFSTSEPGVLPAGMRAVGSRVVAIHGAGWVDAWALTEALRGELAAAGRYLEHHCTPPDFAPAENHVIWRARGIRARHVVFASGATPGMLTNSVTCGAPPLPFRVVKGETVLVHAPGIDASAVVVDGSVLAPRGDGRWVCGATHVPDNDDPHPTPAARAEFETFLRGCIDGPWAIEEQRAGLRAVTPDLRPIVGRLHPAAPVYVFAGLGSRGIALAPWLARELAAHLFDGRALPGEISPARFASAPVGATRWHAVDVAHAEASSRVHPGDTVVDLTIGHGGDTIWLARAAGPRGRVIGFDIQPAAIAVARRRLEDEPAETRAQVELHCIDHARLAEFVAGPIALAMANLGHLPGSDSPVITQPATTLAAFNAALARLRIGGALVAVVYVAHPGGRTEADAIEQWAAALEQRSWRIAWHRHPTGARQAPAVLLVERIL